MNSVWWGCKKTRQRITAEQEKRAAEQVEDINRAYKAAKIPGATPRHWLGKIRRMNKLGRPMPKGLEHLAGSTIDEDTRAFLESGKQSARAYFASEHAGIRAKNLQRTQKKYINSKLAKQTQAQGGSNSGVSRRYARDKNAKAIIDLYVSSTGSNLIVKPVARLVASWYFKNFSCDKSQRAITQMLQRAGVAT